MSNYVIEAKSFKIEAKTKEDAFDILLKFTNRDKKELSLCIHSDNIMTMIVYLRDIADAELIALGYFLKDTELRKTDGLFGKYIGLYNLALKKVSSMDFIIPLIINIDLIKSEDAKHINIRYIITSEDILMQEF